jgi:hypothetical protein
MNTNFMSLKKYFRLLIPCLGLALMVGSCSAMDGPARREISPEEEEAFRLVVLRKERQTKERGPLYELYLRYSARMYMRYYCVGLLEAGNPGNQSIKKWLIDCETDLKTLVPPLLSVKECCICLNRHFPRLKDRGRDIAGFALIIMQMAKEKMQEKLEAISTVLKDKNVPSRAERVIKERLRFASNKELLLELKLIRQEALVQYDEISMLADISDGGMVIDIPRVSFTKLDYGQEELFLEAAIPFEFYEEVFDRYYRDDPTYQQYKTAAVKVALEMLKLEILKEKALCNKIRLERMRLDLCKIGSEEIGNQLLRLASERRELFRMDPEVRDEKLRTMASEGRNLQEIHMLRVMDPDEMDQLRVYLEYKMWEQPE